MDPKQQVCEEEHHKSIKGCEEITQPFTEGLYLEYHLSMLLLNESSADAAIIKTTSANNITTYQYRSY